MGFDARWAGASGVGTYVRELLGAMGAVAPDAGVDLVAICPPGRQPPAGRRVETAAGRYSPAGQVALAAIARRERLDLLHVPFYLPPLLAPCPFVVTIHDLEPLLLPEARRGAPAGAGIRLMHKLAVRRAALVLTNSEDTRRDVVARLGADPARVLVTPLAAGEAFEPREGDRFLPLPGGLASVPGFFLVLAGRPAARKNLAGAIAAYSRYRALGGACRLAVAGDTADARAAIPDLDAVDGVRLLGRVDAAGLRRLYAGAACLLLPSIHEGFGLPGLEALRAGGVVVAADRGALPEVLGTAAEYVRPDDPEQIARILQRIEGEPPARRRARIEAGRARAGRFSWTATARLTLDAYRIALANP